MYATEYPAIINFVESMIYENRATGDTRFRVGRTESSGISFIVEGNLP